MRDDSNPVDKVRQAWLDLDVPEPGAALEDSDPATQTTVLWLQGAWSTLEVPEVQVPSRASMILRGHWKWMPVLRHFQPIQVAAAALVLVSAAVTFLLVDTAPVPQEGDTVTFVPYSPVLDEATRHGPLSVVPISDSVKAEVARLILRSAAQAATPPNALERPLVKLVYLPKPLFRGRILAQPGPNDQLMRQIVRLNRTGAWSEASELAQQILTVDSISKAQKCETLCQMALSLRCLGQVGEAEECLARLEEELRP